MPGAHHALPASDPWFDPRPPNVARRGGTETPVRLPSRTGVTGCGVRTSGVDAEPARGAGPLAARAQPAQPLDEHRVVLEGAGVVEQGVQHLVVTGGAHVEQLLDR